MHTLDYLVVVGYLLLTISLGVWFGRRQSRSEFFAASHSMGWLTVGLSVMATLFSSNSFVFYPASAYGDSLRMSLTLVSHTLIAPLIIWVFIPVYTRLRCETAYEYLERRFGVSVRCLASGLFILLRIGWMASATFAAALILANVSGLDQRTVILSLGAAAIVYTMLGGLRAVMWTDVIQFFVFSLAIAVALGLLISINEGGAVGMVSNYFQGRENLLVDFSPSLTLKFGSWAILLGIFLEALSAFGADQVAVQRYLSAKSERTSQIGFVVNMAGMWFVVPALLMIGVGLFSHFKQQPAALIPLLTDHVTTATIKEGDRRYDHLPSVRTQAALEAYYLSRPAQIALDMGSFQLHDQAMPQFVKHRFPPGMTGLFLAALMAAIMSSIDSGVHSVTTALVVDFRDRLFPHWKPQRDADDVLTIRLLIVGIGSAAVVLACFVGPLGDVFDIGKKLTSAFGGPLLAVFILALFFPRVSTAGVFSGALGAAAATWGLIYYRSDWFSVWFWPIGFGLTMIIAIVLSFLLPQPKSTDTPLTYANIIGGQIGAKQPADDESPSDPPK